MSGDHIEMLWDGFVEFMDDKGKKHHAHVECILQHGIPLNEDKTPMKLNSKKLFTVRQILTQK